MPLTLRRRRLLSRAMIVAGVGLALFGLLFPWIATTFLNDTADRAQARVDQNKSTFPLLGTIARLQVNFHGSAKDVRVWVPAGTDGGVTHPAYSTMTVDGFSGTIYFENTAGIANGDEVVVEGCYHFASNGTHVQGDFVVGACQLHLNDPNPDEMVQGSSTPARVSRPSWYSVSVALLTGGVALAAAGSVTVVQQRRAAMAEWTPMPPYWGRQP